MKRTRMEVNNKGFTLIELLLVVGIIGVLLAVIIPKAIRANTNAKYGIVEKNASELKSYAVQWAEKSLRAQDEEQSTATLLNYYASLTGNTGAVTASSVSQQWIATSETNNWNLRTPVNRATTALLAIEGRSQIVGSTVTTNQPPEDTVEHIIPPEKNLRNPFNGATVFRSPNYPVGVQRPVTGALALGFANEGTTAGYYYFAFAYQGTDSTTADFSSDVTSFHAGSGVLTVPAMKNGVLFARIR